ncbi:hypothetical protein [Caulobacter endophyticus]|uniref:hypothetical protein n=1 Tax=Caulobacter endophyticus TaxID=2172652 RepID=UPI0024109497|nr:hypothetical protein [Caulobacter endophyticus]MDG2529887.1 hypothetical protein [Caulobacter endophyticus]
MACADDAIGASGPLGLDDLLSARALLAPEVFDAPVPVLGALLADGWASFRFGLTAHGDRREVLTAEGWRVGEDEARLRIRDQHPQAAILRLALVEGAAEMAANIRSPGFGLSPVADLLTLAFETEAGMIRFEARPDVYALPSLWRAPARREQI